jgi:hypothetical protein
MGNQADFTNDYSQLIEDATQYSQYQQDVANAAQATQAAENKIAAGTNPQLELYEYIALIYNNISPQIETAETPYGAAEQVQADIERCNNDIHNMINENSSSTTTVSNALADATQMSNLLSGAGSSNPQATGYISEALGPVALSSLNTNFQSIVGEFYTGSGTPPPDTIWAGQGTAPTNAITTFAQLQTDMATPGDPMGANHIYHTFLNAGNTINSTLSTQTNVANTELKLLGSQDKQWLSFGNDMIQMFEGIMKAAQQHAQNANG